MAIRIILVKRESLICLKNALPRKVGLNTPNGKFSYINANRKKIDPNGNVFYMDTNRKSCI